MKFISCALFAVVTLLLPLRSYTAQATQTSSTQSSTSPTNKANAQSAQEITDAKAKGLVWVNTSTHVYHKDGSSYGTTKRGKFMTEADAQKAGYRAAKAGGSIKAKAKGTASQ